MKENELENLRTTNISSDSIAIEWDENSEEDIKGYKFYYRLRGGSLQEIPEILEKNRYDVVGLQSMIDGANRTFQFYVRAIDKMNNESDDSDVLEVDLP